MSDDEQFGFDLEFDAKTEAFLAWAQPERMESEIAKFLSETVSGIASYSETWWQPPISTRILQAVQQLFGDYDTFLSPENRPSADQFVRFLGECCIRRHPGMSWTNSPLSGTPLYSDFCPAVHFADSGEGCEPLWLPEDLFMTNGPEVVDRAIDRAGTPT